LHSWPHSGSKKHSSLILDVSLTRLQVLPSNLLGLAKGCGTAVKPTTTTANM
jgi:hypothetical protein